MRLGHVLDNVAPDVDHVFGEWKSGDSQKQFARFISLTMLPILERDLSEGPGPQVFINDSFVDLHRLFEVPKLGVTNRYLTQAILIVDLRA